MRMMLRRPVVAALAGLILVAGLTVATAPAHGATGGNFFATGHDMDYHCSAGSADECAYLKTVVDAARNGSALPILALDQGSELSGALSSAGESPVVTVDPSNTSLFNATKFVDATNTPLYSAIITASDSTCGGCDNTPAGESNINARKADFATYLDHGGNIIALTGADNFSTYYNFVSLSGLSGAPVSPPFTVTSDGAALGITSAQVNCCATHSSFTIPPSPPFKTLEKDSAGLAETIDCLGCTSTQIAPLSTSITGTPEPVSAGSNVRYTVKVTNSGEASATGVQVTDTLPAGTTFVSSSPGCSGTGPVTCSLGTINGGSSKSVNIDVKTSPGSGGTTITDSAKTTPGGSTATFTSHVAAPNGTSASGHVEPGGSLTTGGTNPATLLLPNSGPGADVTLTQINGATFCAGPCKNPATNVNDFPGYTNPNQPITLRLTLSFSTLAAAQNDASTAIVYKLITAGPNKGTVIVVPSCTTTGVASPSPCVNRRFVTQRPPNWQTTFEILYLSGDGTVGRR